jgi:hypothetical protein
MAATVITPMITPALLRARSLDEPGPGLPHAGISEGAAGKAAVLPQWHIMNMLHRATLVGLKVLGYGVAGMLSLFLVAAIAGAPRHQPNPLRPAEDLLRSHLS